MGTGMLVFGVVGVCGLGVMAQALIRSRRLAPDFDEFLHGTGYQDESPLARPLGVRVLRGAGDAIAARLERVVPRNYLDSLDHQLAQAGLTGKRGAGQHLAVQLVAGVVGAGFAALAWGGGSSKLAPALLLLPFIGAMLPSAALKRRIQARADAIFKDLPDMVDMMAIAVEAGSGLESAISLVSTNFKSPLADELSRTLHDMELGLPRKEALQQLRDRVDVEAVRALVLALLQANALGIPVGRVLKAQATEVRARRRAWAREKAAKLPVKIMFPLVLFIFPPIMALVLGPAAMSFGKVAG